MYSTLLLGLAVVVGAPGAKDPPKKEAEIVGEWLVLTCVEGGVELPEPKEKGLRYTFADDGMMTVHAQFPDVGTYTVNTKKTLAEIDMVPPADCDGPPHKGIFKIDGDTLTLCLVEGKEAARPTKFESSKDSSTFLITLKRVKK